MPLFGHSKPPAPAGPGRDAEIAPLPGLAEYAARAGWTGPLADPGFADGTTDYVHNMMRNLWGGSGGPVPSLPGASAPRYGNTCRGSLEGSEFAVTNVFVTMMNNYAGAGPGINRPGSVCVMQLGDLLPSFTINLRNREDYQYHLSKPVRLGVAEFDHRFDVRSGHPDFAARAIYPMIPVVMRRDDWVFYLEFAQLVSVCRTPFTAVDEVTDRISAMLTLTRAIPPDVRAQHQVARPTAPPDPSLDTPGNRQRLQAIMAKMPPDQRRALVTRLRTEGPNAVFRELLGEGPQ
ncbi:MAG: hypothetical protein ACM3ML_05135 [Micromonosporaceae bacterium]